MRNSYISYSHNMVSKVIHIWYYLELVKVWIFQEWFYNDMVCCEWRVQLVLMLNIILKIHVPREFIFGWLYLHFNLIKHLVKWKQVSLCTYKVPTRIIIIHLIWIEHIFQTYVGYIERNLKFWLFSLFWLTYGRTMWI